MPGSTDLSHNCGRIAAGFDLLSVQNRWTSADSNTVGIVSGPDAIAIASGLPVTPPGADFLSYNSVLLDQIGLTVVLATWFARASRQWWGSYDVMIGAAVGDSSQLCRLKSS